MTDNCTLCHKSLGMADNDGLEHYMCIDESAMRIKHRVCHICGKTPLGEYNDDVIICKTCDSSHALPSNFNGPK